MRGIASGNISQNSQSGGSINDILYRKTKMFMQSIKNNERNICYFHYFCYFKVRGSHTCHGIYFVFHAVRVGLSEMQ